MFSLNKQRSIAKEYQLYQYYLLNNAAYNILRFLFTLDTTQPVAWHHNIEQEEKETTWNPQVLFEEKSIFQNVPLVYIANIDFTKLSNDDLLFYVNIVAWYPHKVYMDISHKTEKNITHIIY